MPDQDSHAAVFDRASPTYDRVGVDFFTTFGRRLVDHAGLRPGERVLDIGTGRGAVLFPAADAVGATGQVVGVDLAPGMVERTAADVADRGLANTRVELADAADLPEDLGTFDAVLSSLVLFFLDDPAAGLRRWSAHVADGGRLGLTTFLPDADDHRLRGILKSFLVAEDPEPPAAGPTPFELVRDPAWLDAALRDAGFGRIEAHTHRHATAFADADALWRWTWSHGMRAALERIPDDRHDDLKAALVEELAATPLPDGRLGLHATVRFTIGRR